MSDESSSDEIGDDEDKCDEPKNSIEIDAQSETRQTQILV
jgi:hypothetical protein